MDEKVAKPFVPVHFAVLTVSDTRSLAEDRSGATLADRIAGAGHVLTHEHHPLVGIHCRFASPAGHWSGQLASSPGRNNRSTPFDSIATGLAVAPTRTVKAARARSNSTDIVDPL